MSELAELKAALERLAGGSAGESDRQAVQQALRAGRRARVRPMPIFELPT